MTPEQRAAVADRMREAGGRWSDVQWACAELEGVELTPAQVLDNLRAEVADAVARMQRIREVAAAAEVLQEAIVHGPRADAVGPEGLSLPERLVAHPLWCWRPGMRTQRGLIVRYTRESMAPVELPDLQAAGTVGCLLAEVRAYRRHAVALRRSAPDDLSWRVVDLSTVRFGDAGAVNAEGTVIASGVTEGQALAEALLKLWTANKGQKAKE